MGTDKGFAPDDAGGDADNVPYHAYEAGLLDDKTLLDEEARVEISFYRWILFFLVGFFPWLVVNAVFAELSVLNQRLPEGKKLSSMAGLACQLANISLIYVVLRRCFPNTLTLVRSVWGLYALSLFTLVGLTLFWDTTIDGHSVVLLGGTVVGGVVGILSIVTLYPWASRYPPAATSAVSSGTASSGILGGVLGLAQGAGEDSQRFSPEVYLALTTVMCGVSAAAFFILIREDSEEDNVYTGVERSEDDCKAVSHLVDSSSLGTASLPSQQSPTGLYEEPPSSASLAASSFCDKFRRMLKQAYMPMIVQLLNCLFNYAFLPGMIPYLVCGDKLTFWYTEVYYIMNVLGRWISTFLHKTEHLLPFLIVLMGALVGGGLMLAHVEDKGNIVVEILVCIGVGLFSMLNGYIETLVFLVPGRTVDPDNKELCLQIVGMIGQVGSFTGTAVTTALVATNQFHKC